MKFALISGGTWLFSNTISQERRCYLLVTRFEQIVDEILQNAELSSLTWEKGKKNGDFDRYQRPIVRLALRPNIVDLFHNGAGGLRAQYYANTNTGYAATKYTIDRLLHERLKRNYMYISGTILPLEVIWESFSQKGAKVWARQSLWLRTASREKCHLQVESWKANSSKPIPKKEDGKLAKPGNYRLWYGQMPDCETVLEIKGEWLGPEGQFRDSSAVTEKQADEIHRFGYS